VRYTYFGGSSNFTATSYSAGYPHGTPRQALEAYRTRYLGYIRDLDFLLATDGPERAEEAVRLDLLAKHPDGICRCGGSHTADIHCGSPRTQEATTPSPAPPPAPVRLTWFDRVRMFVKECSWI